MKTLMSFGCAAAMTVACGFAQAATLMVGADKDYTTPAAALAAAADGDIILMDDGTYVLSAELQVEKRGMFAHHPHGFCGAGNYHAIVDFFEK